MDAFIWSKFIINVLYSRQIQISNTKLQKILYLIYIDIFRKYQKEIFKDPFAAWKLGPVIKKIYAKYATYGPILIPKQEISGKEMAELRKHFSTAEFKNIKNEIVILGKYSTWNLVSVTQRSFAWQNTYSNGTGKGKNINREAIINDTFRIWKDCGDELLICEKSSVIVDWLK